MSKRPRDNVNLQMSIPKRDVLAKCGNVEMSRATTVVANERLTVVKREGTSVLPGDSGDSLAVVLPCA